MSSQSPMMFAVLWQSEAPRLVSVLVRSPLWDSARIASWSQSPVGFWSPLAGGVFERTKTNARNRDEKYAAFS